MPTVFKRQTRRLLLITGTTWLLGPCAFVQSSYCSCIQSQSTSFLLSTCSRQLAMSTNPSHILIARNGRGASGSAPTNIHQLQHAPSPAAPTETHAAASGIFRSRTRGSPSNTYGHRRAASHSTPGVQYAFASGEGPSSSGPPGSGGSGNGNAGSIWVTDDADIDDGCALDSGDEMTPDDLEVDLTFTQSCRFPGTVKIIVESTIFWCASIRFLSTDQKLRKKNSILQVPS